MVERLNFVSEEERKERERMHLALRILCMPAEADAHALSMEEWELLGYDRPGLDWTIVQNQCLWLLADALAAASLQRGKK